MKRLIIIFVLIISTGCSTTTWSAFFYPDGIWNESTWEIRHDFKGKEECLNWINQRILLTDKHSADYECGSNCIKRNDVYVCDETVDY